METCSDKSYLCRVQESIPKLLETLPLARHASEISVRIESQRNLLLTAPTGTGKSSFLPWLLHNNSARIAVLQPRRIAALSLANFLARALKQETGATVGYNFRFDSKQSASTRILFQTYGSFMQQCLRGGAKNFDWIIFDEFHERRTEMDLLLSWLLTWQSIAPSEAPHIAVLSAELNRQSLESLMGVTCLRIESPGFPVQVLHQDPKPSERIDAQVLRAIRTLQGNQVWNTTLVFLPGKSEIQNCYNTLDEAFGKAHDRPELLRLFGGQEIVEQTQIFADTQSPRIIFTTNIAETSLTIPQVSAVIDSGLERSTDYDHSRKIPVLRLGRIAMQNAVQRTGRAGRTRAGACIRLWSERDEQVLPREIIPEILRSKIHSAMLVRAALAQKINTNAKNIAWPTPPLAQVETQAQQELLELDLLESSGTITALGLQVLDIPMQTLELARMLALHQAPPQLLLACCAWLDGSQDFAKDSINLLSIAQDLVDGSRGVPREVALQFKRLQEWATRKQHNGSRSYSQSNADVVSALLEAFPAALATVSESGKAYRLSDSLSIILDASKTGKSSAILAFQLLRSGSGNVQQISRCVFVPVSEALLHKGVQAQEHWQLLWRSGQERFTGLCIKMLGDLEVERKDVAPQDAPPHARKILLEQTTQAWAEKMGREDLSHLWLSDSVKTLLAKMKWAAKHFPEFELPTWTAEDFELIQDEFTAGIFLQRDLNDSRFRKIVEDYFGTHMLNWLHRTLPDTLLLPSGRIAHYSYSEPEAGPIEISARVADFFGVQGKHTIAEGRIEVRYDLLAPNRRTVQKTWDLTGFWQNTYPEVRKELRGRYPRHPWPEDPMTFEQSVKSKV